MRCTFCGGNVEERKVTFSYETPDKFLLVENVPAGVCTKCGERTYSPKVADELLRFVKAEARPTKTITVPVFDFASKG